MSKGDDYPLPNMSVTFDPQMAVPSLRRWVWFGFSEIRTGSDPPDACCRQAAVRDQRQTRQRQSAECCRANKLEKLSPSHDHFIGKCAYDSGDALLNTR
jgi:hypothetical protein